MQLTFQKVYIWLELNTWSFLILFSLCLLNNYMPGTKFSIRDIVQVKQPKKYHTQTAYILLAEDIFLAKYVI